MSYRPPFGAEVLADGETRFSLWAPAAGTVDLVLQGEVLPMERENGGVFSLTVAASPGDRYRFRIDGEREVPDPASRYQPEDAHGPSEVVDPRAFDWGDEGWRGLPWPGTVLYELHVGCFSPGGTFAGVRERLGHLATLGVTAIELMPLSDFPGRRNWGYDGVLPYAPDSAYGRPEDLKELVRAAHEQGLMVFLDVVYNHFGPEGNYLGFYAPQFFTDRHETPWGAAINFDGEGSEFVREFFIQNALYWLEEYRLDGLRVDAAHAIGDDSDRHFLVELAERVRGGPGRDRHVHLVLENEANAASLLRGAGLFDAQWNDDLHHGLHVALTGEGASYYSDYSDAPVRHLGRALAEGFAYQGEPSRHKGGERRGEPSRDLPPHSFVCFLQNHDQVGNRAFGERISTLVPREAVRAAAEVYLLSPQVPMLFMGEEWGTSTPFLFFCDFEPALAPLVTEGRREEFARFPAFSDPEIRSRIPDPSGEETFRTSVLDWEEPGRPEHRSRLDLYRRLLALRRERISPRLGAPGEPSEPRSEHRLVGERGLAVRWTLGDGSLLTLLANLAPGSLGGFEGAEGELLYASEGAGHERELPAWSVAWYLREGG